MAKFCIHCGKPLEDGEVCNCQDNVTTNPNAQNSNNETTNPNTCNPESDINSVIAENSIASENNNSSSNEDKNQNSNSQSATNENANSNSSDTKATFEAGKANAVFEKPAENTNAAAINAAQPAVKFLTCFFLISFSFF